MISPGIILLAERRGEGGLQKVVPRPYGTEDRTMVMIHMLKNVLVCAHQYSSPRGYYLPFIARDVYLTLGNSC